MMGSAAAIAVAVWLGLTVVVLVALVAWPSDDD